MTKPIAAMPPTTARQLADTIDRMLHQHRPPRSRPDDRDWMKPVDDYVTGVLANLETPDRLALLRELDAINASDAAVEVLDAIDDVLNTPGEPT